MLRSNILNDIATDPKVGTTVAGFTSATGLGTTLSWIPEDIGKLATVVGIVLSLVLIYTHLRKGRSEYKKVQLEIALLERKIQTTSADVTQIQEARKLK